MEIMKGDEFRRNIKKGLHGAYLFFGDEDYMKINALGAARQAVCPEPSFAFFNDMRIDALDFSASTLIDALTPLPMMSEQKIVSVSGLNFSSLKPSEIDALVEILQNFDEYDFNVLIISAPAGGIDEGYLPKSPSAILNKLSKHLTPVRFETPPRGKLMVWCQKHFEHNGAYASDDVCLSMFDRCGTSMFTLAAEIDKLSFYVLGNGRKDVTLKDVANVTSITLEADAFALTNAILDGRNAQALDVLAVMKHNRIEPVIVLSEISKTICDLSLIKSLSADGKTPFEVATIMKMSEYKVKLYSSKVANKSREKLDRAIELCTEADRMIKLSPQGYSAIEQLLCIL